MKKNNYLNSRIICVETRQILIEPFCKALNHLLSIENNDDRDKIDRRIEDTGNLFAELMDVLERKDIVNSFLFYF